jgi:proline iminopeptidase
MYVLHGGPGLDHRYFGRSLAELEKVRELYYIDFRGHGKSSKTDKSTYTFETFTDDIEALREEMGHKSIDILGHSMGGFVGLLYSLRFSHNLDSLILVGTVAKMSGITGHKIVKVKLKYLFLKNNLKYRIHKILDINAFARDILLISWPIYVNKNLRQIYIDYINSINDLKIFFEMQNELAGFDITDKLDKIQTPTLIIFGKNDAFLKNGRPLKDIRNSRFSVIPSAKHLPFLEDEKDFNLIVREFLTGIILQTL